jgi:branched-chain amino acid transport system permease protein
MFGVFATLASAVNFDAGYAGVVSFAYAATLGVGAYVTAYLMGGGNHPLFVFLAAVAASSLSNFLLSALANRLADGEFAVATLAVHGIFAAIVLNTPLVGGAMGMQLSHNPLSGGLPANAFLSLGVLGAAILLARALQESQFGLGLRAVREDPVLAMTVGINDRLYRSVAMLLSGALVGAAGFSFALYVQFIHPDSFTTREAILVLCMAFAGGLGSVWGPLIGSAALIALPEALRWIGLPPGVEGPLRDILYGLALALLVLVRPLGLKGAFVPGTKPHDVSVR